MIAQATTTVTIENSLSACGAQRSPDQSINKRDKLEERLAVAARTNERKIAELAAAHPGTSVVLDGSKFVTIKVADGYYNFLVRASSFDQDGRLSKGAILWEVAGTAYQGQVPSGTKAYGIDLQNGTTSVISDLTYTSYGYHKQSVHYNSMLPNDFPLSEVELYSGKLSSMIDDADRLTPIAQTL